jgi:type I restriction enzyme S subunit
MSSWSVQIAPPRDWNTALLGEVCRAGGGSIQTGPFGSQLHAQDYREEGVPIITVEHLLAGKIAHDNLPLVGRADYQRLSRYTLTTGDLVFSRVGAIDRCAYVSEAENGWLFSGRCLRVRPGRGNVRPRFLSYLLNSWRQQQWILNHSVGSTMACLNTAILSDVPIDVPLLPEQGRIEEILSTLDEAIEQTQALIAKYQQIKAGLMHDLFTRGITPDGKLRRTRDEAPLLYEESLVGWIPKEWHLSGLGGLAEIVSGVTLGTERGGRGTLEVPYLRVANVQDGYLDLSDMKTIGVSRSELEKLQLRKGDVLMNEGGDFDKLGRGSVWNEEITPCIHQNHVFRVRPKDDTLRSRYLAFWSQSEFGKRYFVLSSKQSTNLASINSTQLHRFPVSVPHGNEQREIEARLGGIDDCLALYRAEATKLSLLKHGLMHDLLTGRVRVKVAESSAA